MFIGLIGSGLGSYTTREYRDHGVAGCWKELL
jgi:hypothetical protein